MTRIFLIFLLASSLGAQTKAVPKCEAIPAVCQLAERQADSNKRISSLEERLLSLEKTLRGTPYFTAPVKAEAQKTEAAKEGTRISSEDMAIVRKLMDKTQPQVCSTLNGGIMCIPRQKYGTVLLLGSGQITVDYSGQVATLQREKAELLKTISEQAEQISHYEVMLDHTPCKKGSTYKRKSVTWYCRDGKWFGVEPLSHAVSTMPRAVTKGAK